MELTDIQSYVIEGIIIITILIVVFACIWEEVIKCEDDVDIDGVYSDDEEDILDMVDTDEDDPDSPN